MDAKSKLILNGGSGGLTGSHRIVVGAGGLHAPNYATKRQEALKKAILIVVVAALAAAKENGSQ